MKTIKIPINLNSKKIKVNIEMEVEEIWVGTVYSFLKYLEQQCENCDTEEAIMFCVDPKSSNFHPKFSIKNWEGQLDKGMEVDGLKLCIPCKRIYRAGF